MNIRIWMGKVCTREDFDKMQGKKKKMLKRVTSDVAKAVSLLIISLMLTLLVSDEDAIKFLFMLPNIFGILLGGILASLAIIFGLLSSQELAIIHRTLMRVKSKDIYSDFLRNTKFDTSIIFLSTCFSILALLFHSIDLGLINIPLKVQVLLGFVLFGLFMSLSAIYDIIRSFFLLNQLRYELLKKERKKEF